MLLELCSAYITIDDVLVNDTIFKGLLQVHNRPAPLYDLRPL
jgi:hypothetical protein